MFKQIIFSSLIIQMLPIISTVAQASEPQTKVCPAPWKGADNNAEDCSLKEYTLTTWNHFTGQSKNVSAAIRSGYLPENQALPFRGNIIYYEGLGDSMLNHMPLFQKLTHRGYRVIAFDYMGQGGSSGTMNNTNIFQIAELGDKVWNAHARDVALYPKKTILGWSTGGLAAYMQAGTKADVDNIILMAPGIAPNLKIGEQHPFELKFNLITLATLTSQMYSEGVENPHFDPIKPTSPLEVMAFSLDLIKTSWKSHWVYMNERVNGLVLLSGANDSYVNAGKTLYLLKDLAPHFSVKQYREALHEIDNEREPIRSEAHNDIIDFLETHL